MICQRFFIAIANKSYSEYNKDNTT
jgi:hypothetical protein